MSPKKTGMPALYELMGRRSALCRSLELGLTALVAGGAVGLPAAGACAGLYRYIDGDGVVHFTSTPTDRRYRRIAITPHGLRTTRQLPADPPVYQQQDAIPFR